MESKKVLLNGRNADQYEELAQDLMSLHLNTSGPLRLDKEFDAGKKNWIIYVRERSWCEFFYEAIFAYAEEKAAIEKEVLDALEHAFRPIIEAARGAACRHSDEQLEEKVGPIRQSGDPQYGNTVDDDDNVRTSPNDAEIEDDLTGEVKPSEWVGAVEELFESLRRKALGMKSAGENIALQVNPFADPARNNLSDIKRHFYITKRSALEFTANNVIVGSVNALTAGKAKASSSLRRAFSSFREGWSSARHSCSTPYSDFATPNEPQLKTKVPHATLMSVNGLEHIENLVCVADDVKRNGIAGFMDLEREKWKEFYIAACRSMRGSIVRELYPNYYAPDPKNNMLLIPCYSEANIAGAVDAALELTDPGRQDGKDPVLFMFAGLNKDSYQRIENEMKLRLAESAEPPERPTYVDSLPTPGKERSEYERKRKLPASGDGIDQDQSLLIDDDDTDTGGHDT